MLEQPSGLHMGASETNSAALISLRWFFQFIRPGNNFTMLCVLLRDVNVLCHGNRILSCLRWVFRGKVLWKIRLANLAPSLLLPRHTAPSAFASGWSLCLVSVSEEAGSLALLSIQGGGTSREGSLAGGGICCNPFLQPLAWELSQGELAGKNPNVLQPVTLGWHQSPRGAACKPVQCTQACWHGLWDMKVAWSHLCSSPCSPCAGPRSGVSQGIEMEAVTGQEPMGKRETFRQW